MIGANLDVLRPSRSRLQHYLSPGEAGFEDGTVNYLGLPAITMGLRFLRRVGIDAIHSRVEILTQYLLEQLDSLQHTDGSPMVRIFGPRSMESRGGTIAFYLIDPHGEQLDVSRIEELAGDSMISLRTGCFCNPGTGEAAHGLSKEDMEPCFESQEPVTYRELYETIKERTGKTPATIRISVGIASNFEDVGRFLRFVGRFKDKMAHEVYGMVEPAILERKREEVPVLQKPPLPRGPAPSPVIKNSPESLQKKQNPVASFFRNPIQAMRRKRIFS